MMQRPNEQATQDARAAHDRAAESRLSDEPRRVARRVRHARCEHGDGARSVLPACRCKVEAVEVEPASKLAVRLYQLA